MRAKIILAYAQHPSNFFISHSIQFSKKTEFIFIQNTICGDKILNGVNSCKTKTSKYSRIKLLIL